MAAHAVDVTLSGHVNRALFINDSDMGDGATSTKSKVKDNGSSGTRIRVKGTGEMMDGGTAGVLLEYGAGGSGGDGLSMRYADLWLSGGFGKVSIGQGDQGGEGSVYKGAAAVIGTGHGQDTNGIAAGDYFTSLDGGGGRNERLRYDTPAIGPISAGVSIGNGDQVSAGLSLSQDVGGASFSAGVGAIQWPGEKSTVSASAGATLANGLSVSGAWGKGKSYMGALDMGMEGTPEVPAIPAHFRSVDIEMTYMLDSDISNTDVENANFDTHMESLRARIATGMEANATSEEKADMELAKELKRELFAMAGAPDMSTGCNPAADGDVVLGGAPDAFAPMCGMRMYPETPAVAAIPGTPDMQHITDPSFYQVAISYAFGETSVGVSWYQSSDMVRDGSELTAIGAGVNHNLPKLNSNVYAAAQNYSAEDMAGGVDTDDTVVMIGLRIKF